MKYALYANLISLVLHYPITYYFIVHLDLALNGIAYAGTLNMLIRTVAIYVMIKLSKQNECLVSL